jgi:protein SCO1/2
MKRLQGIMLVFAAGLALSLGSCRGGNDAAAQRYPLKGKVVSVDKDRRQVTIAHDEIPGYMAAMTMPFNLKEDWPLGVLVSGQQVTASLVVQGDRSWLEELTITQKNSDSSTAPTAPAEPEPGAEVPDFTLRNQDGRRINLHEYRGHALLITFIYTRCPLPEYCPLMSSNFQKIHAAIRTDPELAGKVRLITVSFDPEYDTADVLRQYGRGYIGEPTRGTFDNWEFASGSLEEVKAITQYFGLSYWQETGQIVHSLRTALIGPDGKLVQLYRGNEWKPAEVLSRLKKLP